MQLVVVGNVGTDHPCQAECSVTAVEVAFYEPDGSNEPDPTLTNIRQVPAPTNSLWEATIKLNATKTMKWSANVTSVINFDLNEEQGPVLGFRDGTILPGYWYVGAATCKRHLHCQGTSVARHASSRACQHLVHTLTV
jgi:hypothetical protein